MKKVSTNKEITTLYKGHKFSRPLQLRQDQKLASGMSAHEIKCIPIMRVAKKKIATPSATKNLSTLCALSIWRIFIEAKVEIQEVAIATVTAMRRAKREDGSKSMRRRAMSQPTISAPGPWRVGILTVEIAMMKSRAPGSERNARHGRNIRTKMSLNGPQTCARACLASDMQLMTGSP